MRDRHFDSYLIGLPARTSLLAAPEKLAVIGSTIVALAVPWTITITAGGNRMYLRRQHDAHVLAYRMGKLGWKKLPLSWRIVLAVSHWWQDRRAAGI